MGRGGDSTRQSDDESSEQSGVHAGSGVELSEEEEGRKAFSSLLVSALRLQESQQPAAAQASAQRTWEKLQFDWPLVEAGEVDALRRALSEGGPPALLSLPLTAPLVSAVVEGAARAPPAGARAPPAGAPPPETAAQLALRSAFQSLAAHLFGAVALALARADDRTAAPLLAKLEVWPSAEQEEEEEPAPVEAHANRHPAAAEEQQAAGSESDWEEALPFSAQGGQVGAPAATAPEPPLPGASLLDFRLCWLAERLTYSRVDLPGVWAQAGLSTVLLETLRALRDSPRPSSLLHRAHVAQALLDRWLSCPDAVDATVPEVMLLLCCAPPAEEEAEGTAAATPLWLLGRLAAGGAQVWPHLHACLVPCVAPQAERAAAALRSRPLLAADLSRPLGDLLAAYSLHAPGGCDPSGELLRCGVLRSVAVLLGAPLGPPAQLRRGALLACAASQPAGAFLTAVPSANAAMHAPPAAAAALWPLATASSADGAAARPLCALLAEAQSTQSAAQTVALEAMTMLLEAMSAAGAARPLWRSGDALHEEMQALHAALRAPPGEQAPNAEQASEGSDATKAYIRRATLRARIKDVLALGDGCLRKKD